MRYIKKEWRLNSMLLQFRFKNFKSFADEAVLDMTATTIKEHSNTLIEKNGIKVLPLAAIFGANASGKSNIFSAFKSMQDDVLGYYDKDEKHNLIVPYIFDKNKKNEPTEYEVSINIDDDEYRYGFVRNKERVLEEWLFEKKFLKNTKSKEKNIFYRDEKKVYPDKVNSTERKELDYLGSMIKENELLLTSIGLRKKIKYSEVYKWFKKTSDFQNFSTDSREYINTMAISKLLYNEESLKDEVVEILNKFDNSIIDLEIEEKEDIIFDEVYSVYTIHKDSEGNIVKLLLESESSGTKKMFSLIVSLFLSLQLGNVLWIDELDAKLHPLILRYIIKMYGDKELNVSNGQLIFSSHNLVCLDSSDLRRDEIWFVEKMNQVSNLYSLYDFRDDENAVRSDLDFGKHYLSGRFGAIPFQEGEENGQ